MSVNKVVFDNNTLIDLTSDTVDASHLLSGYSAHDKSGTSINGSMTNQGTKTYTISSVDDVVTIPQGYHSGSGTVSLSATDIANLIASNIKKGVTILGVTGTYVAKTVTVSVSSNYNTYAGAIDNIIDGDTSTYWWTNGAQSRGKYILFTFSDSVTLNSIRIQTTGSSTDYVCSGSVLQTSSDGSAWTSAGSIGGSKDSSLTVGKSGVKYARIYVNTASSNWLYINEVTLDYDAE